jgi:hypothetical protein
MEYPKTISNFSPPTLSLVQMAVALIYYIKDLGAPINFIIIIILYKKLPFEPPLEWYGMV